MRVQRCTVDTSMGELMLLGTKNTLLALTWDDGLDRVQRHLHRHLGSWTTVQVTALPIFSDAIHTYMDGSLLAFDGLSLDPPGTPFQRRVWQTLRTIPPGATWSYKTQAEAMGKPTAFRAVANANGKNPIPIVIPCHRVIAANGGLGGFSSGLHRKEWLLRHERRSR